MERLVEHKVRLSIPCYRRLQDKWPRHLTRQAWLNQSCTVQTQKLVHHSPHLGIRLARVTGSLPLRSATSRVATS